MLFTSSIVIGVGALVAINGFDDNLREDVERQAQSLLGADLVLQSGQAFSDSALNLMDSLSQYAEVSRERNFASMVYFPKSGGTRLVQVRALEGDFPFYGKILTTPRPAATEFQEGRQALVDSTLMLQFDAKVGDSIKVGNVMFEISGALIRAPGQNGITASVAAPVYIPLSLLAETGLDQKGSRINYVEYFRFSSPVEVDEWVEKERANLKVMRLRTETVESRKRSIGNALSRLTDFLNLVGFVALLLGCVGVASAVYVYVREKRETVAVLRCLGASGRQASLIFLIQIGIMGLIGSGLGAVLGVFIQTALPAVLADFLPVQTNFHLSVPALLKGILMGSVIALLFAMAPLLAIRKISPLSAIRASYEGGSQQRDPLLWLVYGLITAFILGFSYLQMGGWGQAAIFTAGLGLAFLILVGTAKLIMWAVRRFFPSGWSYLWRQALANLYRPNNQTLTLMVSIGLGTALITTLYFVQGFLLNEVELADKGNMPNMVLFDITTEQKDKVSDLARSYEMPIIQEVPIVTMRLSNIKGYSQQEWRELPEPDSLKERRGRRGRGRRREGRSTWMFRREYRATFRDHLIDSETLTSGEWHGTAEPGGPIYISIEEEFAKEDLQVDIGDELIFNIQGVQVPVLVGSFRVVDFQRMQTNFMVVFPAGVLEEAPQFHVLMTRVEDETTSAAFQRSVAQTYPTISLIDLGLVLTTLEDILNKVSFVIRFMALFSILTGLIVLAGSVIISRFQRIQESILLRTLGASRRQVLSINALEYFLLGLLASMTGVILSLGSSWGLAVYSFEVVFVPNVVPMLVVVALITSLTILIGLLNSRGVLSKPPLEVLRKEA